MPFVVLLLLLLLLLCYARLVVKCKKKKEKEKEIRLKYYPDGILSRITSRRVLSMEKKNGGKKKRTGWWSLPSSIFFGRQTRESQIKERKGKQKTRTGPAVRAKYHRSS
jgi:hypothetical protein